MSVNPATIPLAQIDVSRPELYRDQKHLALFERLRNEDPVHYCENSNFGAYWSITRFKDIQQVDQNHQCFSSEPVIAIGDIEDEEGGAIGFISMDQPKHTEQRMSVSPAVAPKNLAGMEALIRERTESVLDALPVGETFNWVEKVSIELTTRMLATLFDFPFEQRHKLTQWSDLATSSGIFGGNGDPDEINAGLDECVTTFYTLLHERMEQPPKNDLISLMGHHPQMKQMDAREYLGNLLLLIVGGNDTTRSSMTGGVLALNQFAGEYDKLRANPELIPSMVSEIIRWQTPLAHMRRTATQDTTLNGKQIRKGDKVVMWYVSGNRDSDVIENADQFIIDRANPRHHLSFGFGIHRCMGNRLAEMQIRVLWEEIMKRFSSVEVVGEPVRVSSNMVMGFTELPVRLHRK